MIQCIDDGYVNVFSKKSRPYDAFSASQCAWSTHCPKTSYTIGVKRIDRHIQGTITTGIFIEPSKNPQEDYYVDAYFAGLWGVEHAHVIKCIKSRAWYFIEFMGSPLL